MSTTNKTNIVTVYPLISVSEEVTNHFHNRGWSWALGSPSVFGFGIQVPISSGYAEEESIKVEVHRVNSDMFEFTPDINTWLSVVECFGLDAIYAFDFVRFAAPYAGKICLHSFSRFNVRPRGAKYFRGRIVDRVSFKKMFEEFFFKHGVSVLYD